MVLLTLTLVVQQNTTKLLQKRKKDAEWQQALEAKREEFAKRMSDCDHRQTDLKHRCKELRKRVQEKEQEVQETRNKIERATQKHTEEIQKFVFYTNLH